jgi:putative transposase
MSRTARVIVPGMPMHITQRGSRRLDVFQDEADRIDYLGLLRDCCRDYRMRLLAYGLMTNHVHFVAIPARAEWNAFPTLQSQIRLCRSPFAGAPIFLRAGRVAPDECHPIRGTESHARENGGSSRRLPLVERGRTLQRL